MKSDYEPRLEENGNALTAVEEDKNEVSKTVRVILTTGFITAVGLMLLLSIYDNDPEFHPDNR